MIIAAASTDDRYAGDDPYTDDGQYGSSELNGGRYGDQYGTGSYSKYSTSRGRYSSSVEIAGYSTGESGTGYGYTAGTESGSSVGAVPSSGYGYTAGDVAHSYEDGVFDYVVDVLDGDPERKPDRVELYIPVDTST